MDKQKKIMACLAVKGSSIVNIININKRDTGNPVLAPAQIALVKKLSKAAQLLAERQRDETLTRRSLILVTLNGPQKETLESSTVDEWFFGQKLNERLKVAKTIERSSKNLKEKPKSTKKTKNFKAPLRRQPFKSRTSDGFQNRSYNQNQQSRTPAQQKKN